MFDSIKLIEYLSKKLEENNVSVHNNNIVTYLSKMGRDDLLFNLIKIYRNPKVEIKKAELTNLSNVAGDIIERMNRLKRRGKVDGTRIGDGDPDFDDDYYKAPKRSDILRHFNKVTTHSVDDFDDEYGHWEAHKDFW